MMIDFKDLIYKYGTDRDTILGEKGDKLVMNYRSVIEIKMNLYTIFKAKSNRK